MKRPVIVLPEAGSQIETARDWWRENRQAATELFDNELDDMILELSASLKTTIVVVTHELPSIFAIATDSVFLDIESRTIIAQGSPKEMLEKPDADPKVRRFLTRGESDEKDGPKPEKKAEQPAGEDLHG